MGAVILCLAVCVFDIMIKTDMCGTGVCYIKSQAFLVFTCTELMEPT